MLDINATPIPPTPIQGLETTRPISVPYHISSWVSLKAILFPGARIMQHHYVGIFW
jgi:hypothetical protein